MQARIYKKPKSAMQSGPRNHPWIVEIIRKEKKEKEPVMGWVSSTAINQLLTFPSQEAAENYAKKHNLIYEISIPHKRTIKPKSYADNFKHKSY